MKKEKKNEIAMENSKIQNTETQDTDLEGNFDEVKLKVDLEGLAALSKKTQQSVRFIDDGQIRIIIDNYYATQKYRMNVANQIRAVSQGYDTMSEGESPAIAWLLQDIKNRENQISKMIAEYVKEVPVCQWALSIKGIGPIFAANLWSYIDMHKCRHANQWLVYAGLNDNNAPWLGKEKAKKVVDDAYKKFGLSASDPIDNDVFLYIAEATGRNVETVIRGFHKHRSSSKTKKSAKDKTVMSAYLAKPPYNTDLKKTCYLIGESFCKVSNRGSLYGEIYKERKALETMKNDRGDYAEQAARMLSEKNYDKDTDTYKALIQGKLSAGHINQRAKRYAVKIFLTHFFEACYIYTYKKQPPTIYPIAHLDHVDYIEPEVPYENFFTWDK